MSDPKYKNIGCPASKIIEECAELIQAIMKAKRFGWNNYHPDRPNRTNLDDVKAEIGDVIEACERFEKELRLASFDLNADWVQALKEKS